MNAFTSTPDQGWRASVRRRREGGFTLLEMIIVMFITSLLVSAVFGIVIAVTQLAQDLITSQQRGARTHAFVELCSRSLRSLPPNAMMRLRTREDGGLYTTELALGDAPSLLSASAGPFTILETETTVDGYLRLVVRSLSEEQLLAWEMGDKRLGTRVVLLENVRMMEWLVFQPQTRQWISVWNEGMPLTALREPTRNAPQQPQGPQAPGENPSPPPPAEAPQQVQEGVNALSRPQRPTLVELRFAMGNEPPQRWVFWVPPRVAGK
ncbi:prepilin-type N-terminal cleavage/methylation domain-containing protein [Roseimicrobium sp. ORNL1]|nr:prepilin-type N-terminal cleavage/methylation domain-containing protein [Roseimicrobium sp. ORNL1]